MAGYETFTSCEGGKGHAFKEPTIGLRITIAGRATPFLDTLQVGSNSDHWTGGRDKRVCAHQLLDHVSPGMRMRL